MITNNNFNAPLRKIETKFTRSIYIPVIKIGDMQAFDYVSAAYNDLVSSVTEYEKFVVDAKYQYAPDLIAFDTYGNYDMWWIICLYNGIIDPLTDLSPGTNLKIPSLNRVSLFLYSKAPNSRVGKTVRV